MLSVWHIIDKYYFFLPRYSLKFIGNCVVPWVPEDMPFWNKYVKLKEIPDSDAKQGWKKKGNGWDQGFPNRCNCRMEILMKDMFTTYGRHKEQNCQCGYGGQTQVLLECKATKTWKYRDNDKYEGWRMDISSKNYTHCQGTRIQRTKKIKTNEGEKNHPEGTEIKLRYYDLLWILHLNICLIHTSTYSNTEGKETIFSLIQLP